MKTAYICGPLTELPAETRDNTKSFYSKLGDMCQNVTGVRAFVPHEHCDPIAFAHYTPQEVDAIERAQVCTKTSFVIAVYVAPSWGSGIEIEMAHQNNVPVIIVCPKGKKISRLLSGNPAVKAIIYYESEEEALRLVANTIKTTILHQPAA